MTALAGQPLLEVPWECGKNRRITQGHQTRFSHAAGTNDAWAWDFGIPEGGAVHAAAAGQIVRMKMDSTTYCANASCAPHVNYIVVDHGDNSQTLYMHLQVNSSPFRVGDYVEPGMFIGRVGLSGWTTGAHLHFMVQRPCNSYWCPSIPARFRTHGDPQSGSITSDNCGEIEPAECEVMADGDVTMVDDDDRGCAVRETVHWWPSTAGYGGRHFFTYATANTAPETTGTWQFGVATAGYYGVEVFIPTEDASTKKAPYAIQHADGEDNVTLDQSANKNWQRLGVYRFDPGDYSVTLGDHTGDPAEQSKAKIAFDALRLTYEGTAAPTPEAPVEVVPETPAETPEPPTVVAEGEAPPWEQNAPTTIDSPAPTAAASGGCHHGPRHTEGDLAWAVLLSLFGALLFWRARRSA